MHARVVEAIAKLRRGERLVDTEEDEIVLWMMSVGLIKPQTVLCACFVIIRGWKFRFRFKVHLNVKCFN